MEAGPSYKLLGSDSVDDDVATFIQKQITVDNLEELWCLQNSCHVFPK